MYSAPPNNILDYLEVSGELHAPAALHPGKELQVPTG
jgi:hypothetical protein